MELRVARSAEVLTQLPRTLTAVEAERAAAFHSAADAADFVAAHLLARACVAAVTGAVEVALSQRCPTCGGAHGPPTVVGEPGVHVAWSHSHGWVAAAAARRPVGVDLETRGRRHDLPRLAARTATAAEAQDLAAADDPEVAYLRMWTRKESLVKVGVLTVAGFGGADVRREGYGGFVLRTTITDDYVLGVALQA